MRSLFFEDVNRLGWRDIPAPKVEANHEVLVSTIAASCCYVDTMIISGNSPFEPPFALGHESVARVIDKGDAVEGLEIGDIVSVPYHRTCGVCPSCVAKNPLNCHEKEVPIFATYGMPDGSDFGGMFSESYRVPYASHALVKIPASVDPLAAVAAGDTLSDAWNTTVPHIRNKPDARVLITSNAGFGLYAAQWALAAGAQQVTYVDDDPLRLSVAKDIGAETLTWSDDLEVPPVYDVIINERQGEKSLRFCLLAGAYGAVVENVVIYLEDVSIPIEAMHYTGVTLRSSFSPTRNFLPEVIADLEAGMINPRAIESEVIHLEDAPERLVLPSHKPLIIFDKTVLKEASRDLAG
ncbi:MAG: alcohol dehydrogenase catalytic domain-containing protein [Rhodobiaceae bacterium]|nr:alcohol dehydrogenase catalytic domain-containing protein [Rhodobiaceae bacterium]